MLKSVQIPKEELLTTHLVYQHLTDVDLYQLYLGIYLKPGTKVLGKSPFRKDNNPSFAIFYSDRKQRYLWKDWGTGESGDVFDAIGKLYGLNITQVMAKINKDFNLGYTVESNVDFSTSRQDYTSNLKLVDATEVVIGVKSYPWTFWTLKYWDQFGISERILRFYKVFPAQHASLRGTPFWFWKFDNPVYAYLFHKDGVYTWKIYRPYAPKGEKWLSNTDISVLQGWDQLPLTGDRLIITKSLKDVMVLRTLGEYSIAMQSEHSVIKPSVMEELRSRFKEIWILQDFDKAGIKGSLRFVRLYPFVKYFFLYSVFLRKKDYKDIAEVRQALGYEETRKRLYNAMNEWQGLKMQA
jgi:hypothetical protein